MVSSQGSKDQLEEVWEEQDGLDPDDFNPKTFFRMHGIVFITYPQEFFDVVQFPFTPMLIFFSNCIPIQIKTKMDIWTSGK